MPAFALTPVSGFPPPTPAEFPNFIQFRNEGVDLGGPDADVVDFTGAGVTATRGVGANANVVTVNVPGGGGGGAAPVLAVSLIGSGVAMGGAVFSSWAGTVRQTSADATWDETDNRIELTQTGLYEVTIAAQITPDAGFLPNANGVYGTEMGPDAYVPQASRHPSAALGSWVSSRNGFLAWTDKYLCNIADVGVDFIVPSIYSNFYNNESDTATYEALVMVRRIGAAV